MSGYILSPRKVVNVEDAQIDAQLTREIFYEHRSACDCMELTGNRYASLQAMAGIVAAVISVKRSNASRQRQNFHFA